MYAIYEHAGATLDPARTGVGVHSFSPAAASASTGPMPASARSVAARFCVSGRSACQLGRACFGGALHLFNHSCHPNLAFDSVPVRGQPHGEGAASDPTPSFALVALRAHRLREVAERLGVLQV